MSTTAGDPTLLRAPPRRRSPAPTRPHRAARARHPSLGLRARHPVLTPPGDTRRRLVRRQLAGVAMADFRPDVEGMRAVAVVAVLLFHAQVGGFSGGFVGVDVFFVLSGFLITRLLLRELATTGTISLSNFWARRARRLLPASVLVLVATVVTGRWMLPPLSQRDLATDATAAGVFVANFVFAGRLGDYFGAQLAETQPSPLLHFWSLAVEEQFYLLWPLLLVLATRRPRQYRRLLVTMILAIAGASVLVSIWMTDRHPTQAFYLLPARLGELLAGAAVAAAGGAFGAVNARFRAGLGWFGLLAIVVAVVTYDQSTVFPGSAVLLPVFGTVLVIVAGSAPRGATRANGATRGPATLLGHPVGQWLGKHSYAIYLWHWPALVLVDARFGPLGLLPRLLVVAGSIGLAAVSVRYVEDPVRHSRALARRPRRGLALGAALGATALVVGQLASAGAPRLDSGRPADAPTLAVAAPGPGGEPSDNDEGGGPAPGEASPPPVAADLQPLAAGDLDSLLVANRAVLEDGLAATDVPSNLRPALAQVGGDRAVVYQDGCVAIGVETELTPCRYGDDGSPFTMVLYGDSHAAQWAPAFIGIAEDRAIDLVVLAKGGCPVAAVSIPTATLARTCPIWRDAAIDFIAAEQPDLVVVSSWADYPNGDEEWGDGLAATMARLAPLTGDLVVLGDNPPARREPAACLSANVRDADTCVAGRDEVVPADRLATEREVAATVGADFVDTTDWLCTDDACPVMIGNILLYRDVTHITTVAAQWLRPLLEASLGPLRPA